MKKICFFLTFIAACICICGCADSEKVLFGYQNDMEKAEAVFETSEGVFKIEISCGETGGRIEIKEPENINGIIFLEEGETVFAVSDNVNIPLSPSLASTVRPIFDAFRLSAENIASITKDENGNTVYGVSEETGAYTVTVNGEAEPVSITFEGDRTFSLTDIILQKNDLTSK